MGLNNRIQIIRDKHNKHVQEYIALKNEILDVKAAMLKIKQNITSTDKDKIRTCFIKCLLLEHTGQGHDRIEGIETLCYYFQFCKMDDCICYKLKQEYDARNKECDRAEARMQKFLQDKNLFQRAYYKIICK